jgi:hypothetical protein
MRHLALALAVMGAILLSGDPAYAQATRTWVSGVGDDANPCSRTAPCKTFAGAISKTAVNGEINCIDPGGFGAVTITKSVTIDCWHVEGSILASGTTGIIVNIAAGNPGDPFRSVRIRGLTITGTMTGIDGIRVLQAASVFIEKTMIQDFSQEGIEVAATTGLRLIIDDVKITNCSGSGIKFATTAGLVVPMLNNVRVNACAVGMLAGNGARVEVRDSLFSHDTTGIQTAGVAVVDVEDTVVTLAATGVLANPGSIIRMSRGFVTQNTTGLSASGGQIISLQQNSIAGNGIDGAFSSTRGKL